MAKTEREIFAANLRGLIARSHLSQADIAGRMGISRGTMSDYTRGRAYPRAEKMTKLCEILGVSQYDLTTDHYIAENKEAFVPNRELMILAREIYENPDARALYILVKQLDKAEQDAIKTIILKLTEQH